MLTIFDAACGYRLPDDVLVRMQEYLDSKNQVRLDVQTLLMAIKWYKDQQLNNDIEGDVDEYLDAFVALGGQPDKEGYISKDVLVEIIKAEFELTIDMVVSITKYLQEIFVTHASSAFHSILDVHVNCFVAQEYLKGIGGDTDEINYYQFCVLLDAGTGGNPSRVSSYLS